MVCKTIDMGQHTSLISAAVGTLRVISDMALPSTWTACSGGRFEQDSTETRSPAKNVDEY